MLAGRADRAIRLFAAAPAQSMPLLRTRLQPVAPPNAKRIQQLVANLDNKQFAVRDRAMKELSQLGELAGTALRQALERGPDLEFRRRIETLLARSTETTVPAPEKLRALRAVEVLEGLGTDEARGMLETLAGGAPESHLTREAAATLRRLAHRAEPMP